MELPEVFESLLDDTALEALIDAVQKGTEVLDVLVKGAPTERTDAVPVGLRGAAEALQQGTVRGMQIRYRYDGGEWRDTVLRAPGGYRVVRIRT